MLQELFPAPKDDANLYEAYASPGGAALLRVNMVMSIDGATALEGRSRGLSSKRDVEIFHLLRSMADAILVGAGTARTEKYKPVKFDSDVRKQRLERGQSEVPPIAVVTNRAEFDWDAPFFVDAEAKPIILTLNSISDLIQKYSDRAEIIGCGDTQVSASRAIAEIRARDGNEILCEGGPTLNASLLDEDLVDELCLTISPMIVEGDSNRIFNGKTASPPIGFEFIRILEEDGFLYTRLARNRR